MRIPNIAAHPDSYGFPPHHPPMTSLLDVLNTVAGRTIGDLYLTDKRGASEFGPPDQRLVELFARHAGIAIENARLHDRLAALRGVAEPLDAEFEALAAAVIGPLREHLQETGS